MVIGEPNFELLKNFPVACKRLTVPPGSANLLYPIFVIDLLENYIVRWWECCGVLPVIDSCGCPKNVAFFS
jgi:hypothetical protein